MPEPDSAENEGYWTRHLTPPPPPLRLPADCPRPILPTYKGARVSRPVPPALSRAVKRLCAETGVTLSAALLGAYTLLLHGLCGVRDTVVWVPAAGQAGEDQDLVGHCVSLLPLRVPAAAAMTLTEYLHSTRTALLDALEHQAYSLGAVMQSLPRPVPMTVTFNLDRFPASLDFGPLSATVAHPPRRFFQFDFGLNVIEAGDALELEADYNADLFQASTVALWLGALEDLLKAAAANSAVTVKALTAPLGGAHASPPPIPAELPPPARRGPLLAKRQAEAPTGTEARLALLWREVLGVPAAYAADNFFEQGGYSLLALRLYGRIEQEFGVRLPLPTLFQSPTLAALAEAIDRAASPAAQSGTRAAAPAASRSTLIPLREAGSKPPLFCVHPDHGLVLFYQALTSRLPPDQPVYGLQAVGADGDEAPLSSLEAMAARYIADIRKFQPHGPYHLGGYSLGGVLAAEMARQLHAAGQQVGLLALLDAYAPVGVPEKPNQQAAPAAPGRSFSDAASDAARQRPERCLASAWRESAGSGAGQKAGLAKGRRRIVRDACPGAAGRAAKRHSCQRSGVLSLRDADVSGPGDFVPGCGSQRF